jgi:hypothetical protein
LAGWLTCYFRLDWLAGWLQAGWLDAGAKPPASLDHHRLNAEEFPANSFRFERRGRRMTGGHRGVYGGMKHDRKARAEAHDFKRKHNSTFICDLDYAVRPFKNCRIMSLSFCNFSLDAGFLDTLISHNEYM